MLKKSFLILPVLLCVTSILLTGCSADQSLGTTPSSASIGTSGPLQTDCYSAKNTKKLILWNKLGSDGEVKHSLVGPDGQWVGRPEYTRTKLGKGMKKDMNTGNYVIFKNVLSNTGSFTIEFWAETPYEVPYYCVPSTNLTLFGFYDHGVYYNANPSEFNEFCATIGWGGNQINADAANWDYCSLYRWSGGSTWSSNETHHFAFVYDKTAGSVQFIKYYFDGVLQNVARVLADNNNWQNYFPLDLYLGVRCVNYQPLQFLGSTVVIGNLKVWNYAKTNFTDRWEGCDRDD